MCGAHQHDHHFPCLHCHPQGYIRMVQHLIERCLLLHMTREDCVKALAERANIRPLVTLTVWKELLKENRGFFTAYLQGKHYNKLQIREQTVNNDVYNKLVSADETDQQRESNSNESRKQQARSCNYHGL